MSQLALDIGHNPHHLARTGDPITSHEAAQRVCEFAKGHALIILECLRNHGDLTVDEIAKRTTLLAHQINKRLSEMQRAKLIEPTGEIRLSASGRNERVWRLKR